MPSFPVTFSSFDSKTWPLLSGEHAQACSWARIVHSAATVGRANTAHVMQHGGYSWLELVYRVTMVLANLKEDASGQLISTDAYKTLDPSEKGAVSYFVGLAVAKLLAAKRLRVPWLMHLDAYKGVIKVKRATASNRRPDLVGLNHASQWVAIEGKGRSGRLPAGLLADAKAQAKNIASVNGVTPLCRVASLTGFDDGALYAQFADPPEQPDRRGIAVTLSENDYLRRYYQVMLAALRVGTNLTIVRLDEQTYEGVQLPRTGAFIGLSSRVRTRLESAEPLSAGQIIELVGPRQDIDLEDEPTSRNELSFVGQDGVAVRLDGTWGTDQMQREVADRSGPDG